MRHLSCRTFLLATLLFGVASTVLAQDAARTPAKLQGSLYDLKDRKRAQILVIRSPVIHVDDASKGAADAVKAGERTSPRYRWISNMMARELNKYIRRYRSMSAVYDSLDADYVIVFNLIKVRRILDSIYPSGELFVITPESAGETRVLWRTEKEMLAEDAIKKLVQDLKLMRKEK